MKLKIVLAGMTLLCGLYRPAHADDLGWRRIEADNGAVFAIAMKRINHLDTGAAVAATCVLDNGLCQPWNVSRIMFDCEGHYQDIDKGGIVLPAPPRSVVGRMAALACAGAHKVDLLNRNSTGGRLPTPAEYCVGFAPDACARITAIVNAKTAPAYCAPGYGLPERGLTPEQYRACNVIGDKQPAAAKR